jgi:hypothetical protein
MVSIHAAPSFAKNQFLSHFSDLSSRYFFNRYGVPQYMHRKLPRLKRDSTTELR